MIICDLCGKAKECFEKEIEGKEYDICSDCWNPLAAKLAGKGRARRKRETVLLPATQPQEPEQPKPRPEHPPKIWGGTGRPQ